MHWHLSPKFLQFCKFWVMSVFTPKTPCQRQDLEVFESPPWPARKDSQLGSLRYGFGSNPQDVMMLIELDLRRLNETAGQEVGTFCSGWTPTPWSCGGRKTLQKVPTETSKSETTHQFSAKMNEDDHLQFNSQKLHPCRSFHESQTWKLFYPLST